MVWGLEWSRSGEWLAIGVNDFEQGKVVIVDETGTRVAELLEAPGQSVESISFSPDARLLATTRMGYERNDPENMEVTIWDWARGDAVATIDATAQRVVFDPTGTHIATNRLVEGIVDVWDVETGERVTSLAAPSAVGALTYGLDGTTLATGHADGTVRLWDPDAGTQRLVLPADDGRIVQVVFDPEGSRLASVSEDGLVRVWTLELDDLITVAEQRLTRTLSDEECRQYLHIERCADP
jgi:WD40 repeat protein